MNHAASHTMSLQGMLKAAQAGSLSRAKLAEEASKQSESDKDKDAKKKEEKGKTASVSTDYVLKIADALDYVGDQLEKESAATAPPAHISETKQEPGKGPGALEVTQATASGKIPDHKGQATSKNVVPMTTPEEKGSAQSQPAPKNALQTNASTPPGAGSSTPEKLAEANLERLNKMAAGGVRDFMKQTAGKVPEVLDKAKGGVRGFMAKRPGGVPDVLKTAEAEKAAAGGVRDFMKATTGKVAPVLDKAKGGVRGFMAKTPGGVPDVLKPKTAEAQDLFNKNLGRLGIKVAEDAANPAHISAGAAVAPETSESGQSGGAPAGGPPKGPTSLISSNEAAINFTRGQAYANRKEDMKKWLSEPMDSAAHDNTLQVALDNTSQAGPKVASAQVKVAAARALFQKLIEEVQLWRSSAWRRCPASRRRPQRSFAWSLPSVTTCGRSWRVSSVGRSARRSPPSCTPRVSATSPWSLSWRPSRRRRKPVSSKASRRLSTWSVPTCGASSRPSLRTRTRITAATSRASSPSSCL